MADLLEQASAWLDGMRTKFASRLVTYQRGESSVSVAATVGRTTFQIDDGSGEMVRVESRDFLITASALVLGGQVVRPQGGDTIIDAGQVYEVMAPGKEDAFRPSDPYGQAWRIHTKRIGSA